MALIMFMVAMLSDLKMILDPISWEDQISTVTTIVNSSNNAIFGEKFSVKRLVSLHRPKAH